LQSQPIAPSPKSLAAQRGLNQAREIECSNNETRNRWKDVSMKGKQLNDGEATLKLCGGGSQVNIVLRSSPCSGLKASAND
jgi:hypothetical protein